MMMFTATVTSQDLTQFFKVVSLPRYNLAFNLLISLKTEISEELSKAYGKG